MVIYLNECRNEKTRAEENKNEKLSLTFWIQHIEMSVWCLRKRDSLKIQREKKRKIKLYTHKNRNGLNFFLLFSNKWKRPNNMNLLKLRIWFDLKLIVQSSWYAHRVWSMFGNPTHTCYAHTHKYVRVCVCVCTRLCRWVKWLNGCGYMIL